MMPTEASRDANELHERARRLLAGGEPLAASVLLQQVVVMAPRNLTFWLSLAAALRALKSHEAELNALERALAGPGPAPHVLICGSLHFVGDVLAMTPETWPN